MTKSGTNQVHGSAYWGYNSNVFNAMNNLDKKTFTKAPWRVENQFAGTVGGPVVIPKVYDGKDKTFFFVSGLRWTDRQFQSGTAIGGAPTADGQDVLRNAVGNLPQIKSLLKYLPAAQTPNGSVARFNANGQSYAVPVGTLSGAAPVTADYWQWLFRGDHRFNDKWSLSGRYMLDDRISSSGQAVPPGLTSQTPARRQAAGITLTTTFPRTMFNELRLGFQRIYSNTVAADLSGIAIPSIEVSELGLTGFNAAASRTAIGLAVNLPQSQVLNNYQLADNFGLMKGNHSMKFGFDIRRSNQNQDFNPTLRGRLAYPTLDALVADTASTASINVLLPGVNRWQAYQYYDYAFYVQDEWRIYSKFTLTYGIRYDSPGNPVDYLKSVNDQVVAANNNNPGVYLYAGPAAGHE